MITNQNEIGRCLDAKSAHKPAFIHDCKACIFLGHYSDYKALGQLEFYDLYLCLRNPTVIARYSDECSEYASGNNAGFFQHLPYLALAAELAIRHMAILLNHPARQRVENEDCDGQNTCAGCGATDYHSFGCERGSR